jgi:hypothetical protein
MALVTLLDELPTDVRLTQRAFQDAVRGRRDLPPLTSIQRHGSWSEMIAEARKRRAAQS